MYKADSTPAPLAPYPQTLHAQRPRLPDVRPHTVHASFPHHPANARYIAEEEEAACDDDSSDSQSTPRASLAGLSILAEAAENRGSRMYMADEPWFSPWACQASQRQYGQQHVQDLTPGEQFDAWTHKTSFAGASRVEHQQPPTSTGIFPGPIVESSSDAQGRNVQSLGRKLSRNYKERVRDFKEFTKQHGGLARIRRASNIEAGGQAQYHPGNTLAPLSPSKRNAGARLNDGRARKFRLGGSDRKDTPAPPPAYGVAASRPAPARTTLSRPMTANFCQPGGDGARAAAARYRQNCEITQYTEDQWSRPQEDIHTRRQRIHSLSKAADSGADLTTYEDQSCKDSAAGDITEDEDMKMDVDEPPKKPKKLDFVGMIPSEITLQIFEYLDFKDLCNVQRMNRAWMSVANEKSVWRTAYMRKYGRQIHTDPAPIQVGGVGVGRTGKPNQEWKKMYQARLELEQNWRKGAREAGKAVYLSGHTDSVYCVQFDEEKIITGSRDRTIRVWDINTYQCLRVIGGPNVRPTPGPKVLRTVDYPAFHIATASVNGTPYGESIFQSPAYFHDASILCLQYDDEILVTGSSDSTLIVWDIHTYEPIKRLAGHAGGVLDVALDSKHIISCSKDSKIIVWDRKTLSIKCELSGHRGPVNAVQLRGRYLVSASGDGIARLWDVVSERLLKEFSEKQRGLAAVEFSEDMKYVLAGGNDHITYKFEVETGHEVMQFTGHTQLVRSLWLDSANNRVVSGSYDLDLRVYDFVTGEQIWRAEEWTTSWMLAAKSDYRRIVATSQDGRILIVDFGLHKGGAWDGHPIANIGLLRGLEHTSAVEFRNPFAADRHIIDR